MKQTSEFINEIWPVRTHPWERGRLEAWLNSLDLPCGNIVSLTFGGDFITRYDPADDINEPVGVAQAHICPSVNHPRHIFQDLLVKIIPIYFLGFQWRVGYIPSENEDVSLRSRYGLVAFWNQESDIKFLLYKTGSGLVEGQQEEFFTLAFKIMKVQMVGVWTECIREGYLDHVWKVFGSAELALDCRLSYWRLLVLPEKAHLVALHRRLKICCFGFYEASTAWLYRIDFITFSRIPAKLNWLVQNTNNALA